MAHYLWVWMSANDDGNRARVTVAQDCIDFIEGHAVHRRIIDFHYLITTPAKHPEKPQNKTNTMTERGPPLSNPLLARLFITSQ